MLQLKLHFESIPKPSPDDPETTEGKLWTKLAEAGVIAAPSWFFATDLVEPPSDPNVEGHFRMSFSNANVRYPFLSLFPFRSLARTSCRATCASRDTETDTKANCIVLIRRKR